MSRPNRPLSIGFLSLFAILLQVSLVTASLFSPSIRERAADTSDGATTNYAAWVWGENNSQFIFATQFNSDTGDIYFHLSAPTASSWVAIGTGEGMGGSLMFIVYASSNGKNATLSPRLSTDEVEPSYSSSIQCSLVTSEGYTNGIINDTYVVNAHCTKVLDLPGQKIDLTRTDAPFIFAIGPGSPQDINSNSVEAGIRRHVTYGDFTMDLTKATVTSGGAVPTSSNFTMTNAVQGDITGDRDWTGAFHALMMCGAFVIIFPAGVLVLRIMEKVMWHGYVQGFAGLVAILGVGVGIYLGRMYNHSKNVNSAHQIIGLVVVLFVIVQWMLGFFHHRSYARNKRPTLMGKIHRYAGPLILLVGIMNGFLGFDFSNANRLNIPYAIIVVIVLAAVGTMLFLKRRRKRKQMVAIEMGGLGPQPYQGARGGASYSEVGGDQARQPFSSNYDDRSRSDIGLSGPPSRDPPAYGEVPTQPRQMV